MLVEHTMTPGRIVHYATDSLGRVSCLPAMIEKPTSVDGDATLILLADEPAGGRRVRALPIHRANGDARKNPNTWHWLDECQTKWPETD